MRSSQVMERGKSPFSTTPQGDVPKRNNHVPSWTIGVQYHSSTDAWKARKEQGIEKLLLLFCGFSGSQLIRAVHGLICCCAQGGDGNLDE